MSVGRHRGGNAAELVPVLFLVDGDDDLGGSATAASAQAHHGYPSSTLLRVLGFSPRHTETANLPDLTQVSGNVSEILVLPTPVHDPSKPPLPEISVVHERSGPRRSSASCLSWLNPRPCLINVEIFSPVNFDSPLHSHHQDLPQYGQGSLTRIDHR